MRGGQRVSRIAIHSDFFFMGNLSFSEFIRSAPIFLILFKIQAVTVITLGGYRWATTGHLIL